MVIFSVHLVGGGSVEKPMGSVEKPWFGG